MVMCGEPRYPPCGVLARLPRDGHVTVLAKAADVFQEPVEKTASAHALSYRWHRFVNDIGLAASVGLLGQAQIAQAEPRVFCLAGAGRIRSRASRHIGRLRSVQFA
jgi:hypothetical protein